MQNKPVISISVQNLLEFSFRSGDLGSGVYTPSRAVDGTKGHNAVRKVLRASFPEGTAYDSEVPVSFRLEGENTVLEIVGRIDGLIRDASGVTIHEIKTTTLPLEQIEHDHNPQHWAQARCYGYMFAAAEKLNPAGIFLTYYHLDSGQEKTFRDYYSIDDLEEFFIPMAETCLQWQEMIRGWQITRNSSIDGLGFPYIAYRAGQQELVEKVHEGIDNGNILFIQAPTGTGKTIATLYPAVKALGEGLTSKIFYLTAKTTTRALAEKALEDMRGTGLRIKSLTLTAKEKICFMESCECSPDVCEYAANYYGRIRKAVTDAFEEDNLDRRTIEDYASRHNICPFELSLDLSLWCDVIICDYNYLFDPRVFLKRFFMQRKGDYTFLIDEAHNLVDRARDMFSAELSKKTFLELKRAVMGEIPRLYDIVDSLNKYFIDTGKALISEDEDGKGGFYRVKRAPPEELRGLLEKFTEYTGNLLSSSSQFYFRELLPDIYFGALSFLRIMELYDDRYVTCYDKSSREFKIKLFCVDPSKLLKEAMDKGRSSILFSATLSPLDYFTRMLGGGTDPTVHSLASPFPAENLCVYMEDTISTRYKTRHLTYDRIAESILEAVSARTGNYMAFFPSFEYLNEVYYRFMGIKAGMRTLYQTPGMSEAKRQEFLYEFETAGETSLVGFAVLGGVFGEGIDLTGDRLSGAIIIGVGLPQICNERNIIKRYFDEQTGTGFEYAYIYPGINRVLQAAGRVIRTETDMGAVILIDERFANYSYKELLPSEWYPIPRASEDCKLSEVLRDFWG